MSSPTAAAPAPLGPAEPEAAPRDRPDRDGCAAVTLDEIESVAHIGSYSLDVAAGHWVGSTGLDAIFGIA
ncbi:MAG: hypothetical protein ACLQHS_11945, partial [Candidatus Limnocylindrales bacterium]